MIRLMGRRTSADRVSKVDQRSIAKCKATDRHL
jgi:hypothetical protein